MLLSFLYSIATICTAYVGFTSLFIALRTSGGNAVDEFSRWSIRYLIAVALTTICTAVLPSVLLAFDANETTALRASSCIALLLLGRLDAIYAFRRKHVDPAPLGWRLKTLFAAAVAIDILFGVIAAGMAGKAAAALYMALELAELVVMFCYFAWALARMLPLQWEPNVQPSFLPPETRSTYHVNVDHDHYTGRIL